MGRGAAGAGGSVDGCGGACWEVDPESVETEERMVFAGEGRGSYQQVSNMQLVGKGNGNYEKEMVEVGKSYRLSMGGMGGLAMIFIVAFFLFLGWATNWIPFDTPFDFGLAALFFFGFVLLVGTLSNWWPHGVGVCGGAFWVFGLCVFITMGNLNNWWQPAGAAPIVIGASPTVAMQGGAATAAHTCGMLTAMATLAQKQLCCSQGYTTFCQSSAPAVQTVHHVHYVHHAVPDVVHSSVPYAPAGGLDHVHWHSGGFHSAIGSTIPSIHTGSWHSMGSTIPSTVHTVHTMSSAPSRDYVIDPGNLEDIPIPQTLH